MQIRADGGVGRTAEKVRTARSGGDVENAINASPDRESAVGLEPHEDRFDKVRGCANVHWQTDDLMTMLRDSDLD